MVNITLLLILIYNINYNHQLLLYFYFHNIMIHFAQILILTNECKCFICHSVVFI